MKKLDDGIEVPYNERESLWGYADRKARVEAAEYFSPIGSHAEQFHRMYWRIMAGYGFRRPDDVACAREGGK